MNKRQPVTQLTIPGLVIYPDRRLLQESQEVADIDDEIIKYFQQMKAVMERYNGIGLAAPQIGLPLRLITVRRDEWIYELINPKIAWSHGSASDYEGCLSLPGEIWQVERSFEIVIEGIDPSGKEQSILARGLTARVFQHEVDHLNGVLINSKGILVTTEPKAKAIQ